MLLQLVRVHTGRLRFATVRSKTQPIPALTCSAVHNALPCTRHSARASAHVACATSMSVEFGFLQTCMPTGRVKRPGSAVRLQHATAALSAAPLTLEQRDAAGAPLDEHAATSMTNLNPIDCRERRGRARVRERAHNFAGAPRRERRSRGGRAAATPIAGLGQRPTEVARPRIPTESVGRSGLRRRQPPPAPSPVRRRRRFW